VNFFDATLFGFAAWQVFAAVALVLGITLLLMIKGRKAPRRGAKRKAPGRAADADDDSGAVQDFMSTVRLSDTQRIDRLHRVVTLAAGEKADLKDMSFGRLPKFSVSFGGVEQARGQDFAHIKIELGGASADCGASVRELGDNDFLVPRATPDDQRCSILYMSGKGDAISFLQVKVQKLDAVERSASIDVLHVRGRQAA